MRRKFQLIVSETLVARARDPATRILREDADRVRHLGAVAERAEALSVTVPATMGVRATASVQSEGRVPQDYSGSIRPYGFYRS